MAPAEFMFNAFGCCFNSCDLQNILVGCKGKEEFLCIKEEACLASNESQFGCGFSKDMKEGDLCNITLPCYVCAIKKPSVCVLGAGQCLFMKSAASFPFSKDAVPAPVCAICAFRILPGPMGCMQPPPQPTAAPGQTEMA